MKCTNGAIAIAALPSIRRSDKTLRKAVLPVAGRGTRFLPATKAIPKEMLPVLDRPLIDYAIAEARAAGIEELIFVTARGKEAIQDHVDSSPDLLKSLRAAGKRELADEIEDGACPEGSAAFVRQAEPKGLGHAIWCARHLVGDEPFAVLLPDDLVVGAVPCLSQLRDVWRYRGGHALGIVDVPREDVVKYGILDVIEDDGRVASARGLVEKPDPRSAPSTLAVIGRYILEPTVFEELDRQRIGSGGEIQITDAIAARIGSEPVNGVRFHGRRYDCGYGEGMLEATVALAMTRPGYAERVRAAVSESSADDLTHTGVTRAGRSGVMRLNG